MAADFQLIDGAGIVGLHQHQTFGLGNGVGGLDIHAAQELHGLGLQAGNGNSGIGNDLHDQLIHGNLISFPVVCVLLELDAVVGSPADELEGAGTNGVSGQILGCGALGNDGGISQVVNKAGLGGCQLDSQRGSIGGSHLGNVGILAVSPSAGSLVLDGVDGVDHVISSKGLAIVEGNTFTQLKGIGGVINLLVGGGQIHHQLHIGIVMEQRLIAVKVDDADKGVLLVGEGIEVIDILLHTQSQNGGIGGLLVTACGYTQNHNQGQQQSKKLLH